MGFVGPECADPGFGGGRRPPGSVRLRPQLPVAAADGAGRHQAGGVHGHERCAAVGGAERAAGGRKAPEPPLRGCALAESGGGEGTGQHEWFYRFLATATRDLGGGRTLSVERLDDGSLSEPGAWGSSAGSRATLNMLARLMARGTDTEVYNKSDEWCPNGTWPVRTCGGWPSPRRSTRSPRRWPRWPVGSASRGGAACSGGRARAA